ncbi:TetR/AcrR family transcriptional regulator C-terminal domain-containing protein [Streptomyces buecherae]|uniref:TetR/AcrR family transcriptional regulator C-terminal domain-containing protein n=1 Tax=Streptomyces buecherae TaxID=2763006 RepID=UPI003410B80C
MASREPTWSPRVRAILPAFSATVRAEKLLPRVRASARWRASPSPSLARITAFPHCPPVAGALGQGQRPRVEHPHRARRSPLGLVSNWPSSSAEATTPSRQEPATGTPAASSALRTERSPGTVTVVFDRAHHEAELPPEKALWAATTLFSYALGEVREQQGATGGETEPFAASVRDGRYPRLAATPWERFVDFDARFDFGVRVLTAGLRAECARRP